MHSMFRLNVFWLKLNTICRIFAINIFRQALLKKSNIKKYIRTAEYIPLLFLFEWIYMLLCVSMYKRKIPFQNHATLLRKWSEFVCSLWKNLYNKRGFLRVTCFKQLKHMAIKKLKSLFAQPPAKIIFSNHKLAKRNAVGVVLRWLEIIKTCKN